MEVVFSNSEETHVWPAGVEGCGNTFLLNENFPLIFTVWYCQGYMGSIPVYEESYTNKTFIYVIILPKKYGGFNFWKIGDWTF